MEMRKGFKQTEVGIIPEDWKIQSLGQVVTFLDGQRRPVKDTDRAKMSGEIPYYGASGIVDYVNDYLFDEDLILLGEDGENILSRNTRLAFRVSGKIWVNNHAHVLRPNPDTSIGFLTDYLEALNYEHLNSGTAQPKLNKQNCFGIPIALPPTLAEQEAIAEALSDADALIEAVEQLLTKKRQVKQGAMSELLTGKRRLSGFSGEWEVKKIGEITYTTSGGTPSTLIASYWGGDIKWMSSGDLHLKHVYDVEGRITEDGLENSSTKIIPPNCVLIGLAGQGKTRGTVAVNMVELCTNQSIAAIFPSSSFVPEYLFFNLDSRYEELREISSGDGGRGGLNLTLINKLEIPLPSIPEQTAIAEILSDMDAEITALEEKLVKARQVKAGMMSELLTGKIRLV